MKKIRLAKNFMKANIIISAIVLGLMVLGSIIGFILLIIGLLGVETIDMDPDTTYLLIYLGTYFLILFSLIAVVVILPGLILSVISKKKMNKACTKKMGVSAGILALIAGAFSTAFSIASGIMLLVTKDEEFKENI